MFINILKTLVQVSAEAIFVVWGVSATFYMVMRTIAAFKGTETE